MRGRGVVVAALTLTAAAAAAGLAAGGPAAAAPTAPAGKSAQVTAIRADAAWIRAAQLPDGAIEPAPRFGRILPYDANYAALGLAQAARELHERSDAGAAWRWLAWYQAHQSPAGFVTDYYVADDGSELSTGTFDSTDAYAGTFLAAAGSAWQADPDQARLKRLARGITKAVAAIQATQTADGLTWAAPGYHEKLLMDNAEAYGGLRSAVLLATALSDPALARRAARDARRVAAGVAALWNPRAGGFNWAVAADGQQSAPSWTVLYPDAMENAWAAAYGLASRAQAAIILSHLERIQPRWAEPDQSAPINTNGVVSEQAAGYWPVAGWALTLAGRRTQARSAGAAISAAAQQRAWPFTTGDAGSLIALQSGWPAAAPWAAPPSAARQAQGPGAAAILAAVAVAVMVLIAAGALLGRQALIRRRRRAGVGGRAPAPGR